MNKRATLSLAFFCPENTLFQVKVWEPLSEMLWILLAEIPPIVRYLLHNPCRTMCGGSQAIAAIPHLPPKRPRRIALQGTSHETVAPITL